MNMEPPDMPSDDLQAAIVRAQEDLARAGADPFLRDDPLRIILSGLSSVIGVFGRSTRRWERAVSDIIAARDTLSEDERLSLLSGIVRATEDGANSAMRSEAKRFIRTLDRGTSVRIGLAVGSAFIFGAVLCWLLVVVTHWGPYSVEAERAAAWHDIIANNPDPRSAVAAADVRIHSTGRRYYFLALWAEPPLPVTR